MQNMISGLVVTVVGATAVFVIHELLKKPRIRGTIEEAIFLGALHAASERLIASDVWLKAKVRNRGFRPVIVTEWRLLVNVGKQRHEGHRIWIPDGTMVRGIRIGLKGRRAQERETYTEPVIRLDEITKCKPMERDKDAAEGWLRFLVPNSTPTLLRSEASIVLTAVDPMGRRHQIKRKRGIPWPESRNIIEPQSR